MLYKLVMWPVQLTMFSWWQISSRSVPYLFEYNGQNCIPKTPTQSSSSVRVINEVLDFIPEGAWVQVRITWYTILHTHTCAENARESKRTCKYGIIRKRMCKYSIFRIACFSIAQEYKNLITHTHTARLKIWSKKKNCKPLLQNGSLPNFHFRCICVARRWVALTSGCASL